MEETIKNQIESTVSASPATPSQTLDVEVQDTPVVNVSADSLEQEQIVQPPLPDSDRGISMGWQRTVRGPEEIYIDDRRVTQDTIDASSVSNTTFFEGKAEGASRPLSGAMGNPLFLDTNMDFPVVKPFEVNLPSLQIKTKVDTTSVSKAAWDISRSIQGVPETYWNGYVYTGPAADTFSQSLYKGAKQATTIFGDMLMGAVGYIGQAFSMFEDDTSGIDIDVDSGQVTESPKSEPNVLVKAAQDYQRMKQDVMSAWNAYSDSSSFINKIAEAAPSAASSFLVSFGAAKMLNSSKLLGWAGSSALQSMAENIDLQIAMEEAGYSPTKQFLVSSGTIAGKTALDVISGGLFVPAAGAVYKQVARDAYRKLPGVMFGALIKRPSAEAATEGAQGMLDSLVYRAVTGKGDIFDTLDDTLLSALLGYGMAMTTGGVGLRSEWRNVRANKQLVEGVSNSIIQNLHQAKWEVVDWAMKAKLFKSEADASAWVDTLIDAAPEVRNRIMRDVVAGEIDKLGNNLRNNKEFNDRLEALAKAGGISEQALLDLDERVEKRLAGIKDISASDKQFIKGLMRGVAFIMSFNGTSPSQLSVPYFRFSYDANNPGVDGSYFDVDNNVINIDPRNVESESPFDKFVRPDARGNNLSVRHRRIIHEMSHYLDAVVGEGFGRYFEAYYGAIQSQFGWQRAVQIKNTATELEDQGIHRQDPKPKTASPTHVGQTTEYFANAVERAAQNTAERAFGLQGVPARFVQYANLMLNGMNQIGVVNEAVQKYLDSIQTSIKENGGLIQELVRRQLKEMVNSAKKETNAAKSKEMMFGALRLQSKLKRFLDSDVTNPEEAGLAPEELLAVVQVLQGYLGKEDMKIAQKAFEGVDTDSLVDKARRYVSEAYDEKPDESTSDGTDQAVAKEDNLDEEPRKILHRVGKMLFPETSEPADPVLEDAIRWLSEDSAERKAQTEKALPQSSEPNQTFESWKKQKVSGRTIDEDMTAALAQANSYYEKAKETPVLNKLFSSNMTGNVDMMLQAVGGEEFAKKYGITYARGVADQYKRTQSSALETEIKKILVGPKGETDTLAADAKFREFLLTSKIKSIEAEQINAADPNSTEKVMLSPLEVMSIYATLKQKASKADQRIDKQYLGKAKELVSKLTQEQIKVADAILKNIHDQWPSIRDAVAEELGHDKYGNIENYMPLYDAFYDEFKGNAPTALAKRSYEAELEMRPIIAMDMMQVFESYTALAGRTLSGFRSKATRLRNMLRLNPEQDFGDAPLHPDQMQTFGYMRAQSSHLYSAFEKVLGEQGARNLLAAIDGLLNPRTGEGPVVSNAFDAATSTMVSSAIAWNFLSWPKNFISNMIASWGSVPNYFHYLTKTFDNLRENIKATRDLVPQIAERFGGKSIDERLNAINATSGGLMGLMIGKPKFFQYTKDKPKLMNAAISTAVAAGLFKKIGLKAFMHHGDAMGLAIGLTPMRLYLQEQGLSDAEVAERIGKKVEELVSTSNVAIDPNAVRDIKRSSLGGLFMFTKDVQVKGQKALRDLMSARRGDMAWGKAAGDIAMIGLSLLAFSMISGGYWDAFSDDDKIKDEAVNSMIRDTIQTMFGMVSPVAGLASSVATYAAGVSGPSGMSTPGFVFMNNFVKDMKNGEILDNAIDVFTVLTGAAGLPRLSGEVDGIIEAFLADSIEERKAAIMKSVGYSENMARKRSGQ